MFRSFSSRVSPIPQIEEDVYQLDGGKRNTSPLQRARRDSLLNLSMLKEKPQNQSGGIEAQVHIKRVLGRRMSVDLHGTLKTRLEKAAALVFLPVTEDVTPCFVVRADDFWRASWDILMLVMLVYVMLIVPLNLGFNLENENNGFVLADYVVDSFFVVDILLNFITDYPSTRKNAHVSTPYVIATNYIKGFLLFDIISIIPLVFSIVGELPDGVNVARLAKLGKLGRVVQMLRITRAVRVRSLWAIFEENLQINRGSKTMMSSLCYLLVGIHLNACFFAFIASESEERAGISWIMEADLKNAGIGEQYTNACYWSVATITTVGFGDIVPMSTLEKTYCIVAVGAGAAMYGMVMSNFVASAATRNMRENRFHEQLDAVTMYMRSRQFPSKLYRKVFKYYRHYYHRKANFDERHILEELSEQLRGEVTTFIAQSTFRDVPLFSSYKGDFLTLVLLSAKPMQVQQGDSIYTSGMVGLEMYIVTGGTLHSHYRPPGRTTQLEKRTLMQRVSSSFRAQKTPMRHTASLTDMSLTDMDKERDRWSTILTTNSTFGELCGLGMMERRHETIHATEITELLLLSKLEIFESLSWSAPQILSGLRKKAVSKYRTQYKGHPAFAEKLLEFTSLFRRDDIANATGGFSAPQVLQPPTPAPKLPTSKLLAQKNKAVAEKRRNSDQPEGINFSSPPGLFQSLPESSEQTEPVSTATLADFEGKVPSQNSINLTRGRSFRRTNSRSSSSNCLRRLTGSHSAQSFQAGGMSGGGGGGGVEELAARLQLLQSTVVQQHMHLVDTMGAMKNQILGLCKEHNAFNTHFKSEMCECGAKIKLLSATLENITRKVGVSVDGAQQTQDANTRQLGDPTGEKRNKARQRWNLIKGARLSLTGMKFAKRTSLA